MALQVTDNINDQSAARPRVLVIDADSNILDLLNFNLAGEFDIITAQEGEQAMAMDLTGLTLIILDITLGGAMSGFDVVEKLAQNRATAGIPFIFCTMRDSEDEIIKGFDAGADDYIVKPFSLREMMARVKSVIRRHAMVRPAAAARPARLEYEGLVIYPETQRVELDGEPLQLSRTEYQILKLFMKEQGRMFSRDEIHAKAWPDSEAVSARTIDVNISRLRKKIGIYAQCIVSKAGQGYGLEALTL